MEVSRQNQRELLGFVRAEMRNQVQTLGLASKRDIERLERRVSRLEQEAKKARGSSRKRTAAKSTAKSSGRKTSAGTSRTRSPRAPAAPKTDGPSPAES